MNTVDEALNLLKRQAEFENAMTQPGGIRVTEEQELHTVKRRFTEFPEAVQAVFQAAHALRRPIRDLSACEVEMWVCVKQVA